MRSSIRGKITRLVFAAILISIVFVGGLGIYSIKTEGDASSEREMNLLCEYRRQTMDEYLDGIEQAVHMVSRYADEELSIVSLYDGGIMGATGQGDSLPDRNWDSQEQRRLDIYLRSHVEKVETIFLSVANHTNSVLSFYYRINPEITKKEPGFWYAKSQNSEFQEQTLTPLDQVGMEKTGWYYVPIQRGRPSWLAPYYNENLGQKVFSYVTPIYKAGAFIGIVGMDFAYDILVEQTDAIKLFDTGYAFLTDEEGRVVYHPSEEEGFYVGDVIQGIEETGNDLYRERSSQELISYSFNGIEKKAAWSTLSNGMKLHVVATVSEMNASWQHLIYNVGFFAILILVAFVVITTVMIRRFTQPLQQLTEAAKQVYDGDYNVRLEYHGEDEVGILTNTFQHLVNHLKEYISDLNSMAFQDALTSVKNKGAFRIFSRKLEEEIRTAASGAEPQYALAMFDLNDLKKINDAYGHEKGDIYIRQACTVICKVFAKSPVFRLGGDEFAALLRGDDFENRETLWQELKERIAAHNAAVHSAWERISIARGLAVYDPARDQSVENTLNRADIDMYEDKRRFKAAQAAPVGEA